MFYAESRVETTPQQDKAELAYAQARAYKVELDAATEAVGGERLQLIQNELDAIYPYIGQQVYVSGNGIYPIYDSETGEIQEEVHGYLSGQQGTHFGFAVTEINEGTTVTYQIWQQIVLAKIKSNPSLTVVRQEIISAYIDLNSSVLLVSDIDQIYNPDPNLGDEDFLAKMEQVMGESKKLINLYKSTAFRRLARGKQLRTVTDFLLKQERKSQLRNVDVAVCGEYAYTPLLRNGWHLVPLKIEETLIEGTIVGLDSTETVKMKAKAIRNDGDLIDKNAGVCLVIDPTKEAKEALGLNSDAVVLLPTANQVFEIALNK